MPHRDAYRPEFPAAGAVPAAFAAAFAAVARWQDAGWQLFPLDAATAAGTDFAALLLQLQYHNQQVWHYEDMGRGETTDAIVRGWRGAMAHNKHRNQCINAIDALLGEHHVPAAPLHSESLGALCDRITILQLKQRAFAARDQALAAAVAAQRDELVAYAASLARRLAAGEVRIQTVPRLKLYLPPDPVAHR